MTILKDMFPKYMTDNVEIITHRRPGPEVGTLKTCEKIHRDSGYSDIKDHLVIITNQKSARTSKAETGWYCGPNDIVVSLLSTTASVNIKTIDIRKLNTLVGSILLYSLQRVLPDQIGESLRIDGINDIVATIGGVKRKLSGILVLHSVTGLIYSFGLNVGSTEYYLSDNNNVPISILELYREYIDPNMWNDYNEMRVKLAELSVKIIKNFYYNLYHMIDYYTKEYNK